MVTRHGATFRMRACRRCGGDAYLDVSDDHEWRCLQCGRLVSHLPARGLWSARERLAHAAPGRRHPWS